MNTARTLLLHALRMLVHDVPTTFRTVLPALVLILGSAILAQIAVPQMVTGELLTPDAVETLAPETALITLGLLVAALLGYVLLAILWHRHVLLDDAVRDTARHPGAGIVMGYIWKALGVALVQMLIGIPLGLAVSTVANALGGQGSAVAGPVLFSLLGIAFGVVLIWFALRVSVVLPAAALGHNLRIAESWASTAPLTRDLLGLAVMLAALNAQLSIVASILAGAVPMFGLPIEAVSYVLETLVIVSVLTTLYGHLVENRALS